MELEKCFEMAKSRDIARMNQLSGLGEIAKKSYNSKARVVFVNLNH